MLRHVLSGGAQRPMVAATLAASARRALGGGGGSGGEAARGERPAPSKEQEWGPEHSPPASGQQLYGRPDRDPVPSPNPSLTRAAFGAAADAADDDGAQEQLKQPQDGEGGEGLEDPQAYPVQGDVTGGGDPSVGPDGVAPDLPADVREQLRREQEDAERAGHPRAAGQGVVDAAGHQDADRGRGRASPV